MNRLDEMIKSTANQFRLRALINMIPIMVLMLIYSTPLLGASIPPLTTLLLSIIWLFHTLIMTGSVYSIFARFEI